MRKRKIVLTPWQLEVAKKFGLSVKQYAAALSDLLKEESRVRRLRKRNRSERSFEEETKLSGFSAARVHTLRNK